MSDKCNCYRFSPRDSLSGAVAQIADYLSKHPGWNETELRAFVDGLISSAGVETFNGRSGNVTLNKDDVNNLLIANCYFAEADETIESIDVLALYKLGIRIVFTQYSSEVDGYTLAYGIEYYPATDTAKAYLFSSGSGGVGAVVSVNGKTGTVVLKASDILMNNGDSVEDAVSNAKAIANAAYSPDNPPPYPVNSVNSKTGSVMLKVVDVSNGNSPDDNAYIFIDETENYPDIIAPDSNKLGGQISSYYATAESVNSLKDDILDVQSNRNLYDKNAPTFQYGIGSANMDVQKNQNNLMLLFDVEEGKTYTISGIRTGWNICYSFSVSSSGIAVGSIASEKLFEGLSYADATRGYKTITIAQGIKCIGLIYWRNGVDTYTEEEKRDALQIEVGETHTDYVPHEMYSKAIFDLRKEIMCMANEAEKARNRMYVKNVPLFTRCSNGMDNEHPDWVSRQYEISALCVHGRYLYTGSHLGFKKWDIGMESDPIDVTKNLESNEYLQKNAYIDQWSINPWGTGGGERIPYKMEYYNGHIYAIARGGSGFVEDDAAERNPNTNVKGETETEGTVGYFIIFDDNLNVLFRQAYYGTNKTEVGYRKPSGFAIDKGNNRIYISCQLYGWLCYDISSPSAPVLLYSYSPLYESDVSSINGADLSSKCGPIEYQNGCVFEHDGSTYYAVAGYVDGIHIWDVTDISLPSEVRNDMITDTYGLFWAFRMHESTWNTTAHVFDVGVEYPYMYATIAPTATYGNDENRISGMIVLDLSNMDAPTYAYYPISQDDWNTYQKIGDVKPSHLLLTNDKVLLNNGNMGIAVYDRSGTHPIYMGCIPSGGDEIYQMARTDDGRLVSGCHIAPFNYRINRGIN